jgi:small subunit ribosomal protein S17
MTMERSRRKELTGKVTSSKMDKTLVVTITRKVRHKLYGKVLNRATKCYVHDEKGEAKEGDTVSIMETRPISKLKRWRLVQVLEKGATA